MTGKEKCEFLKGIRKNMAKENGVPYEPRECHHQGECSGTCPVCEQEVSELLERIKEKEHEGATIHIDNEAIAALEQVADVSDEIEDGENMLLGDIPPGFFERQKEMEEERRIREKYKQYYAKTENSKGGVWNRIKRKISHYLQLSDMGLISNDEQDGLVSNEEQNESEPEHEPDIIWKLDDEGKLEMESFLN